MGHARVIQDGEEKIAHLRALAGVILCSWQETAPGMVTASMVLAHVWMDGAARTVLLLVALLTVQVAESAQMGLAPAILVGGGMTVRRLAAQMIALGMELAQMIMHSQPVFATTFSRGRIVCSLFARQQRQ